MSAREPINVGKWFGNLTRPRDGPEADEEDTPVKQHARSAEQRASAIYYGARKEQEARQERMRERSRTKDPSGSNQTDDSDNSSPNSNTTDASNYQYSDPRTDPENAYMPDEQTPESWPYNPNADDTVTDVHDTGRPMTADEFVADNPNFDPKDPQSWLKSDPDSLINWDEYAYTDQTLREHLDPSGANDTDTPDESDGQQNETIGDDGPHTAPGNTPVWVRQGYQSEEAWRRAQQQGRTPTPSPSPDPSPPTAGSSGSLGKVALAGVSGVGILGIALYMGWL